MDNKKIPTGVGTVILVTIAITVGIFVWTYEKGQDLDTTDITTQAILKPTQKTDNFYSNSDYGFSIYLPYVLNKYVIQILPNTIGRVSFLLPATDQKYLQYTGHKLTNVFSILVYPKSEIDTIRKECSMQTSKYITYECMLNDRQPIAENNMYSFYYFKGEIGMGAYPQALEKEEYIKSENALATFKATNTGSLNFDPTAWHTYTDHDYSFEIDYPTNWRADGSGSPSIYQQDLVGVFSTRGQVTDKINGTLLFGKYNIYNDALTGSIDGNVKYLNSKVNIIGPQSDFKEIKVTEGKVFYNSVQTTSVSNEREIFIVGKNVIFNGNVSVNSDNVNSQALAKFVEILSQFRFLP